MVGDEAAAAARRMVQVSGTRSSTLTKANLSVSFRLGSLHGLVAYDPIMVPWLVMRRQLLPAGISGLMWCRMWIQRKVVPQCKSIKTVTCMSQNSIHMLVMEGESVGSCGVGCGFRERSYPSANQSRL